MSVTGSAVLLNYSDPDGSRSSRNRNPPRPYEALELHDSATPPLITRFPPSPRGILRAPPSRDVMERQEEKAVDVREMEERRKEEEERTEGEDTARGSLWYGCCMEKVKRG